MYRKYIGSAKCSRNERLAQLTEQESVIERKKREILAKIEAQKKRETEEALKKLESSNIHKNCSPHSPRKDSWNRREREREDGEVNKSCPKNAFSNDGSFLDQFKKLSGTGLGPASIDISTLARARKREKEAYKTGNSGRSEDEERLVKEKDHQRQALDVYKRKENNDEQMGQNSLSSCMSSSRKFQDTNIQHHLPPPGDAQLFSHFQDRSTTSHLIAAVPNSSNSINSNNPVPIQPVVTSPVSNISDSEMQCKTVSSIESCKTPSFQSSSFQFNSTEKIAKESAQATSSSIPLSVTAVSPIHPAEKTVAENVLSQAPIQAHNILPPRVAPKIPVNAEKKKMGSVSHILEKSGKDRDQEIRNGTSFAIVHESTSATDENRDEKNEEGKFSGYLSSSRSNEVTPSPETISPNTSELRISPALSNDEADSRGVHTICHLAEKEILHGEGEEHSQSADVSDDAVQRYPVQNNSDYKHSRYAVTKRHKDSLKMDQSEKALSRDKGRSESDSDYEEKSSSNKRRKRSSDYEASDSDTNYKISSRSNEKMSYEGTRPEKEKRVATKDGYQADCEDESDNPQLHEISRRKRTSYYRIPAEESPKMVKTADPTAEHPVGSKTESEENTAARDKSRRKKKSRWGDEIVPDGVTNTSKSNLGIQLPSTVVPLSTAPSGKIPLLSQLTRSDPGLIQYARQTFGSTNLSEEDWKKAEDHYKINLLYQDMVKKRAEIDSLEKAGKFKYEYDSDEDVEGGTWEHKLRQQEMLATQLWAEELTRQASGKHHIGDFLPPEELERFMEKYKAVKEGRKPDLSDYKEFKLKEDNIGYRLLQKMGWNEGQGLGQDGTGITHPVNKASTRHENQGLGVNRPDGIQAGDDEYDAYRKRMMLAYRFRPNPLNNPRRPYY